MCAFLTRALRTMMKSATWSVRLALRSTVGLRSSTVMSGHLIRLMDASPGMSEVLFRAGNSSGGCGHGSSCLHTHEIVMYHADVGDGPLTVDANEDVLGKRIHTAHSNEEILKLVAAHLRVMNNAHMLAVLNELFSNAQNAAKDPPVIIRDSRFALLCDRLVSRARFYAVGDVVNILKYLNFIGVPTKARIVTVYLQVLRGLINDLDLREISYLSFLLKKMDATPVVQALRMALPIVFENKIDSFEADDPDELVTFLKFAVAGQVSHRALAIIYEKLADDRKLSSLSAPTACSLLMAVADSSKGFRDRVQLEKIVIAAVTSLLKQDLETIRPFLLMKLAEKIAKESEGNLLSPCYDVRLFDRLCDAAVSLKLEPGRLCWLAQSLRRTNHHHLEYADCLGSEVSTALGMTAHGLSASDVIEALSYLSEVQYKPHGLEPWADFVAGEVERNPLGFSTALLVHVLVALSVLGLPCRTLVSRLTSRKNIRDMKPSGSLRRGLQLLNALRKLEWEEPFPHELEDFWENVAIDAKDDITASLKEFSLAGPLGVAFGGANYVRSCVMTPGGICADHLVILRGDRYPVAFRGSPKNQDVEGNLKDIDIPADAVKVIINIQRDSDLCRNLDVPKGTAALKSRLLPKGDDSCVVVDIVKRRFEKLLDREKIPYLVRAVEAAVTSRVADEKTSVGLL